VLQIKDKSTMIDEDVHDIAAVVQDDQSVAEAIIKAARTSMGRDLSDADMEMYVPDIRTACETYTDFVHQHSVCSRSLSAQRR
jgi:RNA processing factor Prp31